MFNCDEQHTKVKKKSTPRVLIKWSLNTDLKTTRCKTLYEKREMQDVNNMREQTLLILELSKVQVTVHFFYALTPLYHFTHSLYRFPKNFCNIEKEIFLKNQHQCGDHFLYS